MGLAMAKSPDAVALPWK